MSLEQQFRVELNWNPFVLDIPAFLGTARVGLRDNKVRQGSDQRSRSQWQAARYAYADCRRRARMSVPEVTIYGTQKIWDSSLAGIALLWAKTQGEQAVQQYHRALWAPFWRRELDIEDTATLVAALAGAGIVVDGFGDWATREGRKALAATCAHAKEKLGIFGVPTFVVENDPVGALWGSEHLEYIKYRLAKDGYLRDYQSKM